MAESVLWPVRREFRALATTIVPEAHHLDATAWADLERIVEDALAGRPPALRRRAQVLIALLQWVPLLRYGRPFTSLDPARRSRFLSRIENSRWLLLRRGFWGLRTLVFLGYYTRPAAAAEVGYRAHSRGWEARRS